MNSAGGPFVTGLRCLVCNSTFENGDLHTCPKCGVQGILDVQYDYESIAKVLTARTLAGRAFDHWRYRELLPLSRHTDAPFAGWLDSGV